MHVHELRIDLRRTRPANIVVMSGDADLYVVGDVQETLAAALEGHPHGLVVDLTNVTFVDSSVLGALQRAARSARSRNVPCAFVCDNVQLNRLFQITALDQTLIVVASLGDALRYVIEVRGARVPA